jgi:hypothetical protein
MNERINDLRLEAGISRLHEVPYMVAVNKEGELIEPLEGLQKFAQLIVQECIHVAYNKMAIQKLDGIRPSVVCDAIKEHFGVES